MESRSFWVEAPGKGRIRSQTLPVRDPASVRIRALFSGISRGTEALVFCGNVPASQFRIMRAPYQEGEFPGPVKYGYMMVGTIEEGSEERLGDIVFCLHPHQTVFDLPAEAVFPVPAPVPAARAILAANVETAINACWDAHVLPGDQVLVIGGGVIGLLTGWLVARIPGTEVTLCDPNPERGQIAEKLGMQFTIQPEEKACFDRIFHASGTMEGLRTALTLAPPEATIIEMSWYGDREIPLPLGEAFHSRRLTLRSSQVGRISPHRPLRWTPAERLRLALRLLEDSRLDCLINAESEFNQLPEVMSQLAAKPSATLCHRIRYA